MEISSKAPDLNDFKPWMTAEEIGHLTQILTRLSEPYIGIDSTMEIFEWGSGGSTVYFSNLLRERGVNFKWTSVEYNKGWFQQIDAATKELPDVTVLPYLVNNDRLRQRRTNMDAYVNAAKDQAKKFDFILVDGRKRRRCLLEAKYLLESSGMVALHDASRTYYHCALEEFTQGKFLTPDLWVGRND